MIYLDVTKSSAARHKSGLTRVTGRLREAGAGWLCPVIWHEGEWVDAKGRRAVVLGSDDWLLTAELFSEQERPGFRAFVASPGCRVAAIFHDAIPLKHPHVTWPQSVARHPEYLKLLASFDRVFAVSRASAEELKGFWRWQQVGIKAEVETLALGADFSGSAQCLTESRRDGPPMLLCVGIVEPRKNQTFLANVCEALWTAGETFELHLVGRVNPHFGKAVEARLKQLRRKWRTKVYLHGSVDDRTLATLYAQACATVFPTLAEGCGLPLLESLWAGVPCVCSDLPVLRENADEGGCRVVPMNDHRAWTEALRQVLFDRAVQSKLRSQLQARKLPTWDETADALRRALNN